MAKRKIDVCDNVKDLEHKKFRIEEDDNQCVYVATCDENANEALEQIVENTTVKWDCIEATYPDESTEIYEYYLGTELQYTTTVVYVLEDGKKCKVLSAKKVYA